MLYRFIGLVLFSIVAANGLALTEVGTGEKAVILESPDGETLQIRSMEIRRTDDGYQFSVMM